eukprot:CAMPEP_0170607632 /NCGR_PEP_ID=MMETSP0224-20130122/21157_1 /TAXON_ID=285029 /ORGANISM="Togula jolla, Strain CCCM 725" /LENGTH=36 /DNA_ID= /DNA_START= /DNA_END= /DNA_ORIENTATION=
MLETGADVLACVPEVRGPETFDPETFKDVHDVTPRP